MKIMYSKRYLCGDHNDFGINGICPDADVWAMSVAGIPLIDGFPDVSTAIMTVVADQKVAPGAILLIELQRPLTDEPLDPPMVWKQYLPIEYWDDAHAAIRAAFQRGILVVEAAGNGGQDLDAFLDTSLDSGAILVGAGKPDARHLDPDAPNPFAGPFCLDLNYGRRSTRRVGGTAGDDGGWWPPRRR
jgi:hypothetical protein